MNETLNELAPQVTLNLQDMNNLLASVQTPYAFRTHYVNMVNGVMGIEQMIVAILVGNQAVYPAGIENSALRNIAIGNSMFASEIIEIVRNEFGFDRYPDATIYQYLSVTMMRKTAKLKIGKIKLTNAEDKNRPCCKPRTKFYLVETAGE